MTTQTATRATQQPDAKDAMPIHGIDHLELFVGNAAQAAYYYRHAFGFTETAYQGLETGTRDQVSPRARAGTHPHRADGQPDRR